VFDAAETISNTLNENVFNMGCLRAELKAKQSHGVAETNTSLHLSIDKAAFKQFDHLRHAHSVCSKAFDKLRAAYMMRRAINRFRMNIVVKAFENWRYMASEPKRQLMVLRHALCQMPKWRRKKAIEKAIGKWRSMADGRMLRHCSTAVFALQRITNWLLLKSHFGKLRSLSAELLRQQMRMRRAIMHCMYRFLKTAFDAWRMSANCKARRAGAEK